MSQSPKKRTCARCGHHGYPAASFPDGHLCGRCLTAALETAGTRIYDAPTLPMMGTGATDMSQVRARGTECYGISPASDSEDGPKGFGAHSDQERILESELHRFVRFEWDVVSSLAAAK